MVLIVAFLGASNAEAEPLDGTWKYAPSGEFSGEASLVAPLGTPTVQVLDSKLALLSKCVLQLGPV